MHWKSSLLLVALALGLGFWLWKGDAWSVRWGLRPAPEPDLADSPSIAFLTRELTAGKLRRIEIPSSTSAESVMLLRDDVTEGWKLPGNWPMRSAVADELIELLTSLRTRFAPIPITETTDLSPFGLAAEQNPVEVKIQTEGRIHTLRFGEAIPTGYDNRFTRPTYLRIDDWPELLRLGPNVLPIIRRPLDEYRKRQIFANSQRLRLEATRSSFPPTGQLPTPSVVPVLSDDVQNVSVAGPSTLITILGIPLSSEDGNYTLARRAANPQPITRSASERAPVIRNVQLAAAWELQTPVRSPVEPDRLRGIVTALPDFWVESFVQADDKRLLFAQDLTSSLSPMIAPVLPFSLFSTLWTKEDLDDWFMSRVGLGTPQRRILLSTRKGPLELRIGDVAQVKTINEGERTEFRYAMLADNPSIFRVNTNRFSEVFVKSTSLRDPRLARFDSEEIEEILIEHSAEPPVRLSRVKGDPKAATESERQDRWYLARNEQAALLADSSKVNELLSLLSNLETPAEKQTFNRPMPSTWKISLRSQEVRTDNSQSAQGKTITFFIDRGPLTSILGIPLTKPKEMFIAVGGWPRVDRVDNADDRVTKVIDRPALAYRSRKLFDTNVAKLQSIEVKESKGESFALVKDESGSGWVLTQPPAGAADANAANKLTDDLSRLEVREFLSDTPSSEDLARYHLDQPELTVSMTFKENQVLKTHKLLIGGPREGGNEVFARLDDGSVFTISKDLLPSLKQGALSLLPTQILDNPPLTFTRLEFKRSQSKANEQYILTPTNNQQWQVTGPFTAPIPKSSIEPLLTALNGLKAHKYEAFSASDPKAFGFDSPDLVLNLSYTTASAKDSSARSETRTLIVGKATSDRAYRYAQIQGGSNSAVFLLDGTLIDSFDRSALDLLDTQLLSLDQRDITGVKILGPQPEENVALLNLNGKWTAENETFTVDRLAVQSFLNRLANLRVVKIVGYGEHVKWENYGLSPAERRVLITLGGAKPATHTIALGKKDATGDRYIRVDDGPALAIIYAGDAADLTPTRLDFVDRTLLSFNPSAFDGLSRVKGSEELVIEPGNVQGWTIVKPASHKADLLLFEGGGNSEGLINLLARLRAIRIAAYGKREILKSFGLENPTAAITIKMNDGSPERVLKIGNTVDQNLSDGDRFVFVEGPGPDYTVGIIPADITKMLLAEPIFFRDRTLAAFRDADKLIMERGDRRVIFEKLMGTWRVVEPLQADAEHAELDELMNALASLRADELVKDKSEDLASYGLDRPVVIWRAFNRGKEELSLMVGKTENSRAYAKLANRDEIALLDRKLTERVLAEYRKRKVWDGVDAAQVDSVVVSIGSERTYQFSKFGPSWDDPKSPKDRISTAAVNDFLGALAGLTARRYVVDVNADPKLYGLDKPQRVIVLNQRNPGGGSQTRTLRIGGFEGGSDNRRVYASVDEPGRSDVFVISEADTARILKERTDFLDKPIDQK